MLQNVWLMQTKCTDDLHCEPANQDKHFIYSQPIHFLARALPRARLSLILNSSWAASCNVRLIYLGLRKGYDMASIVGTTHKGVWKSWVIRLVSFCNNTVFHRIFYVSGWFSYAVKGTHFEEAHLCNSGTAGRPRGETEKGAEESDQREHFHSAVSAVPLSLSLSVVTVLPCSVAATPNCTY